MANQIDLLTYMNKDRRPKYESFQKIDQSGTLSPPAIAQGKDCEILAFVKRKASDLRKGAFTTLEPVPLLNLAFKKFKPGSHGCRQLQSGSQLKKGKSGIA